MRIGRIPVQTTLGAWPSFGTQPCCTRLPVTFKSKKNKKQWLTLGYWCWTLNSGTKLAMGHSNCSAKWYVLRKDFLDILKNQMWWNSLENFYCLINTVLRNRKKWKYILYIHFVVLHIQIPKVPCFVCLSDCYDKVDTIDLKDKNRSQRQLLGWQIYFCLTASTRNIACFSDLSLWLKVNMCSFW